MLDNHSRTVAVVFLSFPSPVSIVGELQEDILQSLCQNTICERPVKRKDNSILNRVVFPYQNTPKIPKKVEALI